MPTRELSTGATVSFEDQGTGRPIVLLHGVAMSRVFFERNVEDLATDHRVIALDFRGHGSSPQMDEGHEVAQYARDVRALLVDLDLQGAVLVGWSMGSLVIWDYLRQFGQDNHVAGVVIISQGPSDLIQDDWPHGIADHATLGEYLDMMQSDSRGFLGGFLPEMFHTSPDEATIERFLDDICRAGTNTATLILADQTVQDYRADMPSYHVPHLLVWGSDEKVVKLASADWLSAQLPNSEVHVFDTSGHCPMWEEADRFNALVRQWVRNL